MANAPAAYLTPRAIADRFGLAKTDGVLAWIAKGELAAVNVSAGSGRPTWRIPPAALDAFLAGRRGGSAEGTRRVTRRKRPSVTQYF